MKNALVFFMIMLASPPPLMAAHKKAPIEISLGNKNAPITVIEYTSLSCNHCADFHLKELQLLKKKLIDTGQVRLIIRPFAMDKVALEAFMLVLSLPEKNQEMAMGKLFSAQILWIEKKPEVIGKFIGLTPEQVKQALNNKKIEDALLSNAFWAQKEFKIEATPSFLFGDEKVEGAPSVEEFTKKVNELRKTK